MVDNGKIILTVKNLSAGYRKNCIINNINFDVCEGEIISVLGANGSGKSTLLKAMLNLLNNINGEVAFYGNIITGLSTREITSLGISVLHQYNNVFSELSIKQNIEINVSLKNHTNLYEYMTLLNNYSNGLFNDIFNYNWSKKRAGVLSGGEKQKLALLMVLSRKSPLILMDEPTASLSSNAVYQVMTLLKEINKQSDTTFIIVEQNIKSIMTITDKVLIMKNGLLNSIEDKNNLLLEEKLEEIFLK